MKCVICSMEIDDIDQAIDQGWTPYFYEGDIEHGPVCPGCSGIFLHKAEDGEMELNNEYQGKIQYNEMPFYELSLEEMLISVSIENTTQRFLN